MTCSQLSTNQAKLQTLQWDSPWGISETQPTSRKVQRTRNSMLQVKASSFFYRQTLWVKLWVENGSILDAMVDCWLVHLSSSKAWHVLTVVYLLVMEEVLQNLDGSMQSRHFVKITVQHVLTSFILYYLEVFCQLCTRHGSIIGTSFVQLLVDCRLHGLACHCLYMSCMLWGDYDKG